ncbi:hypothetical protein EWM64_g7247, partial [Hericium alpestre]
MVRKLRDPIHDYIQLHEKAWGVIDTPHFQRLREIKQLGTSYYVWPTASHNRFEHCLGVAFLARRMTEHLANGQPELGITDREIECVELAGLCHDLGHGPWSHVWDSQFIPRALKGKKWQHEDASEMMFDDMLARYKDKIKLSERDAKFIKALIAGDSTRVRDEKSFLFDIVANKRNGLDVDKLDYIARDSWAIGDSVGGLSLSRIIDSARVIDDQICYDIKDANQIYELCHTRFSLHKRIYNHKTAKAVEHMIIDAMLAAEPTLKIAEQIDDPKKYLHLTDCIMNIIEQSTDPALEDSRRIFARIKERDLYRCVDYHVFDWDHFEWLEKEITAEAIVAEAQNLGSSGLAKASQEVAQVGDDAEDEVPIVDGGEEEIDPEALSQLKPSDVAVAFSKLHHGMSTLNPLDFTKFYSKRHPNVCRTAGREHVSCVVPVIMGEVLLRVYTKEYRFYGIIQAAYRLLKKRLCKKYLPDWEPAAAGTSLEPETEPDLSQPTTEGPPATPPQRKRTLSRVVSNR